LSHMPGSQEDPPHLFFFTSKKQNQNKVQFYIDD